MDEATALPQRTPTASVGSPSFIVSAGRCGSTLLSQIVALDKKVLSLSELFTVLGGSLAFEPGVMSGSAFLARIQRIDPGLRTAILEELGTVEGSAALSPLELIPLRRVSEDPARVWSLVEQRLASRPDTDVQQHLSALFSAIAGAIGREAVVERSGASLEYFAELAKLWPHARFVLLVRDGVRSALSMSRHPVFRWRLAQARSTAREVPPPLGQFGAYWSILMHRALCVSRTLAREQLLLIRYEDLLDDPARELGRLIEFLRLNPEILREAVALVRPGHSVLSADDEAVLGRTCAVGARSLRDLTAYLS